MAKIVEEISDSMITVAFRCEEIPPTMGYDDQGIAPALSVEVRRNKQTAVAASPSQLIDAIRAVGLTPKTYAEAEPLTMARAAAYLEDSGRLIRRHPLFIEMLEEQKENLDDLVPHFENSALVWHVLGVDQGVATIQKRRMQFD